MTENKNLIDPFGDDTKESLQEGIKIWNEIFSACPNFADGVITLYKKHGIKCLADSMAIAFKPDVGPDPITKEEPYFYYNDANETWELRWRHPNDPEQGMLQGTNPIRKELSEKMLDALAALGVDINDPDKVDPHELEELEKNQVDLCTISRLCEAYSISICVCFDIGK